MSSSIVRYGSYSEAALEKDAGKTAALSGGNFMDLLEGENVVRFLPPPVGSESPFRMTAMHYIDAVPGLEKMVVFACPRVELKQPCIACQKSAELNSSGNPVDREMAYKISAGLRIYANVLDRKNPEAGVRVLGFGKSIQSGLAAIRKSARLGGDFTNPTDKGFDIIITRTGTGMQTRYAVMADRNSSPLAETEEEIMFLIENQHDLNALVNPVPPDELVRAWSQAQGRMGPTPSAPRGPQDVRQLTPQRAPATVTPAGPKVGAGLMGSPAQKVSPSRSALEDASGRSVPNDPFADE